MAKLSIMVVAAAVAAAVTSAATGADATTSGWNFAFGLPAGCTTKPGFSQQQCARLNRAWVDSDTCVNAALKAAGAGEFTGQTTTALRAALAPFATWVSVGCDTPCATQAKKKRINPKKFCDAQPGSPPTKFIDGGCKGIFDCQSIRAFRPFGTRRKGN